MRNVRGFFQNFFTCSSGRTRFSKASYTPGYRKKLVSCVSNRSSSASYSRLDLRITRRCSRTRAEKKRSRDSSKQIPVRSSISMRISFNSCSLGPCTDPWRSVIVFPFWGLPLPSAARGEEESHCLTKSACRDGPLGIFTRMRSLRGRAELRQRFVQLIRKFDQLANRRHRSARSLRRLPCNAGNNLHRVRHTFRSAHLLLRCQGDFLNEFC